MFLENPVTPNAPYGWIEVICGSMFSGKTEELIRRLKRAKIAKQRVEIFKPLIDTRYDETMVVSHDDNQIPSTPVPAAANIRLLADGCDVVGIDEAQFLTKEQVWQLARAVDDLFLPVLCYGLRVDFQGNLFPGSSALLGLADELKEIKTICHCGKKATMVVRKSTNNKPIKDGSQIQIGGNDLYESLCRIHWRQLMES